MRQVEGIFASAMALMCIGYLYLVWEMDDFGSVTEPGAAFVPGVMGVVVLAIALKILAGSLAGKGTGNAERIPRDGLLRFGAYAAVSLVFIPVFEIMGAYVAIFALVLVLTKILGSRGWIQPMILAALSAVIAYGLFYAVLDVPLPRGIF